MMLVLVHALFVFCAGAWHNGIVMCPSSRNTKQESKNSKDFLHPQKAVRDYSSSCKKPPEMRHNRVAERGMKRTTHA